MAIGQSPKLDHAGPDDRKPGPEPLAMLILGPDSAVAAPRPAAAVVPPDDATAPKGPLILGPDTAVKSPGGEGVPDTAVETPRAAPSIGAVLDRISLTEAIIATASDREARPSRLSGLGPSRRRTKAAPDGSGAVGGSEAAVALPSGRVLSAPVLEEEGGRRRFTPRLPAEPPAVPSAAAAREPDVPPMSKAGSSADAPNGWSARQPLAVGIAALILLFGGVGVWSVSTTLTGAVVAAGMIVVESNRQVIQHPDGGVVRAIHVREGDRVAQGDVLVELDGARIASQLAIVEGQLGELVARRARLEAERDGGSEIRFPPELIALAAANPVVSEKLEGERALFSARVEALELQSSLVAEQNRQIDNRIKGIEAQLEAARTESGLLENQLADQQGLLDRGLTQLGQVLDLQRALAELKGRTGSFEAEIAGLRGEAAGNGITLLQVKTQRQEDAVRTLRDLEFSQIELIESRLELMETLSRLEIRAPGEGIVYDSQVFALQSVVQPGAPLMYIVPQEQPLVITARVASFNIDEVFVGQDVSLRFAAFDQRLVPELKATVQRISADILRDEGTGEVFYEATILPLEGELAKLGRQTLVPGMPVDAFIRTRERSALTYLLEPFTVFFSRAFRE